MSCDAAMVIINAKAAGGHGLKHWNRIIADRRLSNVTGQFIIDDENNSEDLSNWMRKHLDAGWNKFIAVGGDGTINALLNAVMVYCDSQHRLLSTIKLGAIGIGSSNDFHKPFSCAPENRIAGYPCRLDFAQGIFSDILFVRDRSNNSLRYFLINASLGITAQANYLFNNPDRCLRAIKSKSSPMAILYAAIKTMIGYKNKCVHLAINGKEPIKYNLTNLGAVKNRHFSGSFRYDKGAEPYSGDFWLHLCRDMCLVESLRTLFNLAQGRFRGLPKTESLKAQSVTIKSETPICVEMDGEVCKTNDIEIGISDKQVLLCR